MNLLFKIRLLAALSLITAAGLHAGTVTFTDHAGRTREIPSPVTRVYATTPMGTIFMYTIAPEMLVGLNYEPSPGERKYFLPETLELPVIGGWFGKNGTTNLEALIAAKPDIILSVGHESKTGGDFADRLERQTGIPVIVCNYDLERCQDAYELLGRLLGREERAKELGDYCRRTCDEVTALSAKIPESERVSYYYAEGPEGLQTDSDNSVHAVSFRMAGGTNVCLRGQESGPGRRQISMEQVMLWNPDAVFISMDRGADTGEMPAWIRDRSWQGVPAVKNGRIYKVPTAPFNWMDRPPAVNRIIGVRWAFWCMYPDRADFDMVGETRTFFQLFYHYEMSEAEARKLLQDSKGAMPASSGDKQKSTAGE